MHTDLRVYLGLSEFGEKMNSRFSCSSLMVSELDSELEGLGSRPGSVIVSLVVSSGKTLHLHSVSQVPGV